MEKKLFDILQKQGIEPKNKSLYCQAVTHSTFANESNFKTDYQRLEFLGDALLTKASAEKLFELSSKNEGYMSILRAHTVSGKQLAIFAKEIELEKVIRFGASMKQNKVVKDKILADAFEALIAAIYLDLGEESMNKFLENNVYKFIIESKDKNLKNPKTVLQELLQSEQRGNIKYKVIDDNDGFTVSVLCEDAIFGEGQGRTKKEAEIRAAEDALKKVSRG